MLFIVLAALFCFRVEGLCGAASYGLDLEAKLSLHFSELSVTEDGGVRAKMRNWGFPEFVGVDAPGELRQAEKGETVFIPRGSRLFFHHGGPRQALSNLSAGSEQRNRLRMPKAFRDEPMVLVCRFTDDTFVIAPRLGKACHVNGEEQLDLPFPFQSIWASEDEETGWFNARDENALAEAIEADGRKVRRRAEELYRRIQEDPVSAELLRGTSSVTNVPLKVEGLDDVESPVLDLRVAKGNGNRTVQLRYLTGSQVDRASTDIFDGDGKLLWAIVFSLGEGERRRKGTVVGAFEFGKDGGLSRAWTRDSARILLGHGARRRFPVALRDSQGFFADMWRSLAGDRASGD